VSSFAFGYFERRRRIVAVNKIAQFGLILLFVIHEELRLGCIVRLFKAVFLIVTLLVKTWIDVLKWVSIGTFEFCHVIRIHVRDCISV